MRRVDEAIKASSRDDPDAERPAHRLRHRDRRRDDVRPAQATVWLSVYGGEKRRLGTLAALEGARSDVVTTPVTVTKPIRGSFSVGIVSETTALIASSTRRIRGDRVVCLVIEAHQVALVGSSSNSWPASQRSAVSMSRSASPASRATHASVRRERCQTSWWSTSAIEQPTRFVSCALTDLRCMRFSFREWLSGKRSSNE